MVSLTVLPSRAAFPLRAWFASHPGGPIDYEIRDLTVTPSLDLQP